MSFDVIARDAGARLRDAAAGCDIDSALDAATGPRSADRGRRRTLVAIVACALATVVALWLVGPRVSGWSDRQAPVIQQPNGQIVDTGPPIRSSFQVPSGWSVSHEGGYVRLTSQDASANAVAYVGVVSDVWNLRDRSHPLKGSLSAWTLSHPFLNDGSRTDAEADGWLGSTMQLLPRPGQAWRFRTQAPLVTMADSTSTDTVDYATSYRTFSWTVLSVGANGRELLVALSSNKPDDPNVAQARADILESLHFTEQPAIR